MGFWAAMDEVYPETQHQRCWQHKTMNMLNCLPKLSQPKSKAVIHSIWQAETKADAEKAFDLFIETYEPKYPKAGCACKKTGSNSWHSAYKASRPMSFRRCYGPEYISGLLMHGLRHAAFRSNNPARQAVTECVYRPLQSHTPRTVGSEHL